MVGQLTRALEDRAVVEKTLQKEQERSRELTEQLTVLQRQRRTTERLWFEPGL